MVAITRRIIGMLRTCTSPKIAATTSTMINITNKQCTCTHTYIYVVGFKQGMCYGFRAWVVNTRLFQQLTATMTDVVVANQLLVHHSLNDSPCS